MVSLRISVRGVPELPFENSVVSGFALMFKGDGDGEHITLVERLKLRQPIPSLQPVPPGGFFFGHKEYGELSTWTVATITELLFERKWVAHSPVVAALRNYILHRQFDLVFFELPKGIDAKPLDAALTVAQVLAAASATQRRFRLALRCEREDLTRIRQSVTEFGFAEEAVEARE